MSLKETLKSMFSSVTDSSLEDMMNEDNCYGEIATALDNQSIAYESVDSYGGEDQGSHYWCVWKFSKDGEECFVKVYGYYASHYGTDYQGYKFVTPKQKTVIVYE
jgi:hypothetical protein